MYDFFDYVCFTVATILMVVLIWLAVDMMTVARQADHDSQEVEYYRKTYDEFVVPGSTGSWNWPTGWRILWMPRTRRWRSSSKTPNAFSSASVI